MNERIKKNTINKVSVLLLWAIHIGKTIFMFRGVRWKDELPIVNVDYIIYYARALRAHEFYEKSGRFWGYDPYEMAGYVSGPIHEAGNYLMSWVSHVLSGVIPIHRTLLILEIMGLFLVPVMMYGAVKVWRENEEEAWAAFGVTVLMQGVYDLFSSFIAQAGLFTFQVGTALSFLAVSLMWRAVRQGGYRWWLAAGGAMVILPQVHPGTVFIVGPPLLALYIFNIDRMSLKNRGVFFGVLLITFVSNWYWLEPYLHFSDWGVQVLYMTAKWQKLVSLLIPIQGTFLDYCQVVLVWVFLISTIQVLREFKKAGGIFWFFIFWMASLALLAYGGSYLPAIKKMQPGRFVFPMWMLVYLLGTVGLVSQWGKFRHGKSRSAVVFACLVGVQVWTYAVWPENQPKPLLKTQLEPAQQEFLDYLKTYKTQNGRLLIESTDEGPHFQDMIPGLTKMVLIGGSNPGNNLKSRTTLFVGGYWDGKKVVYDRPVLFGRPVQSWSVQELKVMLDLYNIESVACLSDISNKYFSQQTALFEPMAQAGEYVFYQVNQTPSWFIEGSGTLTIDYDALTISNPSLGSLILKFHYLDTLKTAPPLPIHPIWIKDDPVPFIRIENIKEASTIKVYNAGL
jgi:hypothetical protein